MFVSFQDDKEPAKISTEKLVMFVEFLNSKGITVPKELRNDAELHLKDTEKYEELFLEFFTNYLYLDNIPQIETTRNNTVSAAEQKTYINDFLQLINDKEWKNAKNIVQALLENDKKLYNLNENHKNWGKRETYVSLLEAYPESFAFLMCENKIIGNYSYTVITPKQVELLKQGELYEADFSLSENDTLNHRGNKILYILNLSVNIGWNTTPNMLKLSDKLWEQLLAFAEVGVYFETIYVNVFRDDHARWYTGVGFKPLCIEGKEIFNKEKGQIYVMENFPNDLIWEKQKQLEYLYNHKRK